MAGLEPPPGFRVGPQDALLVALTPALGSHGAPSKTMAADLSGRAKAGGRGSRGCLWLLKGKHEPPAGTPAFLKVYDERCLEDTENGEGVSRRL